MQSNRHRRQLHGTFDAGDPTATTDANGQFTFFGLAAGTYVVREQLPGGFTLTDPQSGSYSITLLDGQSTGGLMFGDSVSP